jgi:transposase InsO family protein
MSKHRFSQDQKRKILKSTKKLGVRSAAEIAGVHYTTVYEWRRDFESLGEKAFLDYKSSYPGRGVKQITPEQETAILTTRKNNPGFGPGQVRNQLRRQGITISIRTVRKVMQADGYRAGGKKRKDLKFRRFEATRPLELAQMDILEFFINKLKVYLILLLDDFSRFILGFRLLESTSVDAVISVVSSAMDRYGKMDEILTDRGFVFYSWRGINRFEKFLQLHRIDHTHARPHHPQTLGKVEACNRRIKQELIDQHHFPNLHESDTAIGNWVAHYNYQRTHQGIGGLLVPSERFHGQAAQVLSSIEKGMSVSDCHDGSFSGIERSIMNLVVGLDGEMTLYILGRPMPLTGGIDAKTIERR